MSKDKITNDFDNKTDSQINDELQALLLEEKRLDLELKREAVAANRSKIQNAKDQARAKAIATKQYLAQREAQQARCNHRKGGQGAMGLIQGQGTSAMYAVIKHILPNAKTFVMCQRCYKEWQPPSFSVDGEGNVYRVPATAGWEEAVAFPTDNTPSGSSIFTFEGVEAAIQRTANAKS